MEKDEIKTYKIDDSKITNDNNRCFKVFYTLERKDGNISYCLENFNEESLNINEMNGYENMLLNICFSNFYNKKEISKEYQDLISIEKEPRTIKEGKNMRYELYKDLCFLRSTSPSSLGYIFTINKWVKDFEEDMNQSAMSDSKAFDDYIEYKVLSEIAKQKASEKGAYGNFLILVDIDEDIVISVNDRIDVGDPHTETFTEFLKDTYKDKYVIELSEYDNYLKKKLSIEEEEER